ncbi:anaerobic ribonucleoside-triphosphate reductase [Candidatus Malacoplasma girerdii]|uniref:Anaerobic ribonucleoside-triphosphate reductase n=1 Tax=Candidatus Malacoplasma girerdii TaxID=1318617 RepID=A0A097SS63_9BACT|nr:anaerobic ribonucleoside-triphosphate reductase [Candidatus Malacoplasma girerdii]
MKFMRYIIKRDNRKAIFDLIKIQDAIIKAAQANQIDLSLNELKTIVNEIDNRITKLDVDGIEVERVQDIVVKTLTDLGYRQLANLYQAYREERTIIREGKSDLMKKIIKIGIETDRDNANVGNNFSAKLLRIASEANKWHILNTLLPRKLAKLHENGDIYIHDLDSYNLTLNCLHLPTGKILARGFNTGYGTINPPHSITVAAALICIMMQASQNDMFGGQSHPNFDNDLAPYVALSRSKIRKELMEKGIQGKELEAAVEQKTIREVRQAMQAVIYNLNTMHSRAGSQVPFSSLNLGIPFSEDAALVCQCFLEEYIKGLGGGEQPIFPNIIFRVKAGINRDEGDKYNYLFKLACKTAAIRMNPTFMNIDADFNKEFFDQGIMPATMGCRTYIMTNCNGKPGVEGRGNNAPCTINLPRLGILAKGNINTFFSLLDQRINDVVECLLHRAEVLKKLKVKDLPFVAGQKLMVGSENLGPNDTIEKIMEQGSWGIGYIGLAESLIALTGKHHGEDEKARELGLKIVTHIRNRCDELKEKYKMNFACYATPAEGLSGKFVVIDRKKFGVIPGVTDKDYYTNSYHVPVYYPIGFAEKMKIEAPYHKLSNGGHISYIEFDSYPTAENIEKILQWCYKNTNINYIGINFHIRYCLDCAEKARKEVSEARQAEINATKN